MGFAMNRILIAESDKELAYRLKEVFIDVKNYPVSCDTIKKTRAMLDCEDWALVLADEELADGSGFDLLDCADGGIIVMMMLSENTGADLGEIRRRGAADFIKKPFNPVVLKARVSTLLEKKNAKPDFNSGARFEAIGVTSPQFIVDDRTVYIDNYEFDFDNKEYKYMDKKIMLSGLEQSLLRILVENRGVVLKKDAVLERLRKETDAAGSDILADTIDVLKEKLHASGYIKTIYGVGYMWIVRRES
ncbi:MAG: winged helix-turn-helix domain-containing protein [Lachnospiraceae bacterium]|nr:winged helix-turn-helix domain-containing protein [Lachnospiraceae bacterium]